MNSSKDLARELERQYLREWRAKNKDKMRQYRQNYWARKAALVQQEMEEQNRGEVHRDGQEA